MKSNLMKVSLALLSTVVLLGCQDLGTGVVASDGPGPQFGKVKNCDPKIGPVHPSCEPDDEPTDDATYTATITGDVESVNDMEMLGHQSGLATFTGTPGGSDAGPATLNLSFNFCQAPDPVSSFLDPPANPLRISDSVRFLPIQHTLQIEPFVSFPKGKNECPSMTKSLASKCRPGCSEGFTTSPSMRI